VPLKELENSIAKCIDTAALDVKSNATPELSSIRKSIERAQVSARKKMEAMLKSYGDQGLLQENVISVRGGRLVLVVKDEHRRKVKGLVHDQSATGSSYFIEPLSVVDDNNRVRELYSEEAKEIERILRMLTDQIREQNETIEKNLAVFAELDFIYAKARLSKALNATKPELVEQPVLSIFKARHPLLLLRMGEKAVIPMDVSLGENIHTLIISGPNAGGKTVALKTVGLVALMTSCGLHIPAQPHSRVSLLPQIFANIGDQQSLENDLSTFSSHLQDLKEIAEKSDDRTLVLVDEIASGTDPEEGTALAIALMERLTERRTLSIVTTHQSPLKAFAFSTDGVENASLEFDVNSLLPTYFFRTGVPGSSYAFEIAQRMGLPKEMTERARQLVGSHKNKLEGLLLELEERTQNYKELQREASIKETEYKGLLKLYQERNEALKKETNAIKRQALQDAEALIKESNAKVEQAIREIRESNARKENVKAARENLQQQKEKIERVKKEIPAEHVAPVDSEPVENGDFVTWQTTGGTGQVISDVDKKGRVMVQFDGGMKASVPMNELIKNTKKRKTRGRVRFNVESEKRYTNELDIRGMLGEDAVNELEHFLDEAMLAGFGEVQVIHGKGTGKLRKHVSQYLQRHPQVIAFRLGYWNEGDSGVTVVELKGKTKITYAEE
jgi:DNA mismatch repair protein MutS2